jgi:predicted PurR-regulated permease PerM
VAVLAIVFAPLHVRLLRFMPKRQNLPALATVLIILALVIVPLTLTAASLVQEAANFHESMQAGTWNLGDFFKQFLAVLPSWAIDLRSPRAQGPRRGASEAVRCSHQGQHVLCLRGAGYRAWHDQLPRQLRHHAVPAVLLCARRRGAGEAHYPCHSAPPKQQNALVGKSTAVIRATFKGNLLVAAVQGALGGLSFWFLGISAPVLWAVVMALCSLLPAVGAAIVWFPVAVYFSRRAPSGRGWCSWPMASL